MIPLPDIVYDGNVLRDKDYTEKEGQYIRLEVSKKYVIFCIVVFRSRKKYSPVPLLEGEYTHSYFRSFFKSSSGVDIGEMPKLSTRYFSTFGEMNAGSVGPR